MQEKSCGVMIVAALIPVLAVGVAMAKKPDVDPAAFMDVEPAEAAENLLAVAREQAGDGSWERIAVARVHYLSGDEATGREILDEVVDDGAEASDWIRIGRIYYEAGDWERAREAFERVVGMKPKDEDWLAEIGAYYNLQGERQRAEELFRRSFEEDPRNHHNAAMAAGSYVGVAPE